MTERIFVEKSTKYKPIAEDIINAMKNFRDKQPFSVIKYWGYKPKVTYSDSEYPFCIVHISSGTFDSFKIPKGATENIKIIIQIEHKSYKDDKTDLIYRLLEDVICLITSGISFNSSSKYKVKTFHLRGWDVTPNTDGSFMFDTLILEADAQLIICPNCQEEVSP